jgi:hypothetical protein
VWQRCGCQILLNSVEIKRAAQVVEPEDGNQHQDRAEHRVQNEFHGCIDPAIVTPDSDHEIHRDQGEFPENEKQKEVERKKDADHGRLDHQNRNKKALHILVDRFPGAQNGERRQECGQQNQEQADAVHTEMIVNAFADPVVVLGKLIGSVARIESPKQQERNGKLGNRSGQRDPSDPDMIVRAQQKQCGNTEQRKEGNHRQQKRLAGHASALPP